MAACKDPKETTTDNDDYEEDDDDDDKEDDDDDDEENSAMVHSGKKMEDLIFSYIPTPVQVDLKLEFGDKEIFLVDGDSLVFSILTDPNDLVTWSKDIGGSSLHIIYLAEKALKQFVDRGGKPQLVFFEEMRRMWAKTNPALALLREIVIRHFKDNVETTGVPVVLEFGSAVDPSFQSYLREESVLMMCLTFPALELEPLWGCEEGVWNSIKATFHYLIAVVLGSGLNVSLLDEAQVTVASVFGYHMRNIRVGPDFIVRMETAYVGHLEKSFPTVVCKSRKVQNPYQHLSEEVIKYAANVPEPDVAQLVFTFLVSIALNRTKMLPSNDFLPDIQIKCKPDSTLAYIVQGLYTALYTLMESLPLPDLPQLMSPLWIMRLIYCQREHPEKYKEFVIREGVQKELEVQKVKNLKWEDSNVYDSLDVRRSEKRLSQDSPHDLCTIDNPLFSKYLGDDIRGNADFPMSETNRIFEEKFHWHVMLPISDELSDRQTESTMKAQNYANYMTKYGTSIEGGIVSDQPIVVESKKKDKAAAKKIKKNPSKKFEELRRKNIVEKCSERVVSLRAGEHRNEERKVNELKEIAKKLKGMTDPQAEKVFRTCNRELLSMHLKKALESFLQLKLSGFKDVAKEVSFLCDVKTILESDFRHHGVSKTNDVQKLAGCLATLGYSEFALNNFPKEDCLPPPPTNKEKKQQRSIVHFQMEHMGQHLELERPEKRDPRIDDFVPDEWQRRLFDAIDHRQSALIIAPTSSGKTYASYYCMEQVLRESDEGVVVYVAPTKALVNQVAATVYARFGKRKKTLASVYGVFTRDYRYNTKNCQVLVTVPACLEILLFSPARADWCGRLRYVIFDEVHNIGAEGDASAWEHTLLMIRCPFLALSATVANPGDLHRWMENLERIKETQDRELGCLRNKDKSYKVELVEYGERHADLVKYVYRPDEGGGKKKKPSLKSNLSTVHPLSLVKVKDVIDKKLIPRHIALSAKESLELFHAMAYVLGLNQVSDLEPSKYFSEKFITRNDVSRYCLSLFNTLERLEETRLRQVVQRLPGYPEELLQSKRRGRQDFLDLLQILKTEKMLPALVFVYDRSICNHLPLIVMDTIDKELESLSEEEEEKKIRGSVAEEYQYEEYRSESERSLRKKGSNEKKNKDRPEKEGESSYSAMEFFSQFCYGNRATFVGPNSLGEPMAAFLQEQLGWARGKNLPQFVHCLQLGVSWHHSGNNNKLRMATEMLFRCGFLNLVVATTTLAQGIHMPCKTVIFFADSLFLNTLSYHQCSGRAGRRGFDTQGNVIFFDVPRPKISRLVTSPLPMLLGNEPIRLTLILRILIFVANIKMEGRRDFDVRDFAIQKVLCLLRGPLILQVRPEMEPQLRHFFMFGVDYLARQGYLDRSGNPIGFSGLASHLHYLEPFNFAFCHLLREGRLHKLCRRDEHGNFTEETMEQLLLVVSTLFGRRLLHRGIYEYKRENRLYHNSKVLLEDPPAEIREGLREFNRNLKETFSNFLGYIATRSPTESCLPLSGTSFQVPGDFRDVNSIFSSSDTHEKDDGGNDTINGLFSNTNAHLFTSFLPLVDLDACLNRYVLDFFNHGVKADLVRDNGVTESELYRSLDDVSLVIRAISTSLREIGPSGDDDDGDDDDDLVEAFAQLAEEFKGKMTAVYPDGRSRKKKGCVKIHESNCAVCDRVEEGKTVTTLKGVPFTIKGFGLTCQTRNVVYAVKCLSCRKLYVGESVRCLQEKVRSFVDPDGLGDETVRRCFGTKHRVVIQVLDAVRGDERLSEKRLFWKSRLWAEEKLI